MEDDHVFPSKHAVPFCCALLIPLNFGPPKCTISSGNMAAARAAMPKTSVHKNREFLSNEIKIWATRKRHMQPPTSNSGTD
jgi:hypothetical protein